MTKPDKCLDSQLWHACAGGMVQMPPVNSLVCYFPQGHAEHTQGNVDFGSCPNIPELILCRVSAVEFMADPETDEVFAKMRLVPVRSNTGDCREDECGLLGSGGLGIPEKPASFAKTLTQSDANNGGGFSVPRYCAETIFPPLDYSANPPVQTVLAKDVHGQIWKFRHIYRGTPRRHLLTTGWSNFVNEKKLVAGDSIVFLRAENGDLCLGVRRSKKGVRDGAESLSRWNPPSGNCMTPYDTFSFFSRERESKLLGSNWYAGKADLGSSTSKKVRAESVIEAATLAAKGLPFEVVYYPRANTPEFCVKASALRVAMRIRWCPGMRFKMAFETEDSSRISWFMGTISAVQVTDPIRWSNSPWRLLQVTWDEPDLLQNVKCVSPWLVELVSDMPTIPLTPFSPPRKKMRIPRHPEFPFDDQLVTPTFSGNPFGACCRPFQTDIAPAGIQGARHAQFGLSLPDPLSKLQLGLFPAGGHNLAQVAPPSTGPNIRNTVINDNISRLLTPRMPEKSCDAKVPQFLLFGQPILTEKQLSLSSSDDTTSPAATVNSSSDGNRETAPILSDNSSSDGLSGYNQCWMAETRAESGHCKVFMESEDVGRTLDLSVLGSYEELYRRLADMFSIHKSEMMNHVLYRDSSGAVKHAGDEPFRDFMKTARRLKIGLGQ